MVHAAESLHWYDRLGQPAYTVKAKDGSPRPATLRDARKLNLVPSVTSIIRCAAAPGLERWKQEQVLLAALTLPKVVGENEQAYLRRILDDSREQARNAADRGTTIHAALQGYFLKERTAAEFMPHIQGACDALKDWCGEDFDHECCLVEKSFAHPLGFGGKVDIFGTSPLFIADFKTKEFDTTHDLKTWDEQAMQLAAYRYGLEMPAARCAIVYVSSSVPGLCHAIEIGPEELEKGWVMFQGLLYYWMAKTGYTSAWTEKPRAGLSSISPVSASAV